MFKEKKIPTILGLLILIGGIAVSVFLTNQNTSLTSKASGNCKPQNPQITNITNNSVSIFFTTESACLSTLSVNNQIIQNEAVISTDQKSKIHYFDVNNLTASTEYIYSLIVDGKTYDESSYKFQTAVNIDGSIPSSNLAWGRVFTPELKAAKKVVVFVNISGAFPLSALVTSSGNWNISLASTFNAPKTARFVPTGNTSEEIIVIDQDIKTTQINGNTSNNNPTPDIILGQNNFSNTSIIYDTKTDTGSLSSVTPVSDSTNLDILNPKNNDSLSTEKPDFFGTGPKNSTVQIEVHSSTVYTGEVTVNDDGSWNWSPPADLEPGEHTITATVIENGIKKVITRNFTVLAADNALAYSASSSAITSVPTLAPTSTPTSTPTPTISSKKITSTPTPTPTLKPTLTIVPTLISSPTSTISGSNPSTHSGVPTTGNLTPTVLILLASSSFIVFSFFSFKKK